MAYLTLFTAWMIALVSPGPDFLAVVRTSASEGRRHGQAVAFGVVAGIACWTILAMTGLSLLLTHNAELYFAVRVAGAAFLIAYGLYILWSARRPGASHAPEASEIPGSAVSPGRSFRLGLATNLANPKAVVFFGALFVTVLPPHLTGLTKAWLVVALIAMALLWFTVVARIAASRAFMNGYRRAQRTIDVAAGGLFTVVGVALLPR